MGAILLKDISVDDVRKDILIQDGLIRRIEPAGSGSSWGLAGDIEIMDCSGKVAVPGFVNMHTHSPMSLMRGIGEDMVFQDWLDRNSNEGEYHLQGIVDEKAIFDYVILPLMDENGYKMTPDKFAGRLRDELEKQGIYSSHRAEGNTIFLTLEL